MVGAQGNGLVMRRSRIRDRSRQLWENRPAQLMQPTHGLGNRSTPPTYAPPGVTSHHQCGGSPLFLPRFDASLFPGCSHAELLSVFTPPLATEMGLDSAETLVGLQHGSPSRCGWRRLRARRDRPHAKRSSTQVARTNTCAVKCRAGNDDSVLSRVIGSRIEVRADLNREIRRCTDVEHDEWADGCRYLGLEVLNRSRLVLITTDNPQDNTHTDAKRLTRQRRRTNRRTPLPRT